MNDTYTLITTKVTDATPEQIWDAWNDPEKVAKWWGPAGFKSTVEKLDVREGGKFKSGNAWPRWGGLSKRLRL